LVLQESDRSAKQSVILSHKQLHTPTLSVGSIAGRLSPAFLVLVVVSINSGVNRLLGFGVSWGTAASGIELGEGSGVGKPFLKVVSTGSGKKRRFGAKSFFSTPSFCEGFPSSFLLLRVMVSTGSGANRRTFFVVVSTGVGANRLPDGGGDVSDMMVVQSWKRGPGSCQELVNPRLGRGVSGASYSYSIGILLIIFCRFDKSDLEACDQNTVWWSSSCVHWSSVSGVVHLVTTESESELAGQRVLSNWSR
jgi:hypothetical protein